MVEIIITPEMIKKAQVRANEYKNKLNKSILNGEGTLAGCIGEEMFRTYIPEAELVGTYDYDFVYKGKTFDIKTKVRTVAPKPNYDCTVNAETYSQRTDYYVFVSILKDFSKGWIVGYCNKKYFNQHCYLASKGQTDPSNGYHPHVNQYNIYIKQLGEIEHLKNE